jgi:hypothetical protein
LKLHLQVRSKQHIQKLPEKGWSDDHWRTESDDCSEEVGIVSDVVQFLAAQVKGVIKVENAKDDPGYWKNAKKVDIFPGIEENSRIQNG